MSRFNDCGCSHNQDEDLMDFVHSHRPKAMRRELPEARSQRNAAISRIVVNGMSDEEARGMVPPKYAKGR